MSSRSSVTQALVVSLSTFGEGHREASLLTPDRGIVRAAVFGGAKSRLRSLVSPWHTGTAWLYSDPVRHTVKITDFDVTDYRQGLRESLTRSWCASVCTEIIARGRGTADWRLVNGFLDGLALSGDDDARLALLRFMWRTLVEAGLAPDIGRCAHCGAAISGGAIGENGVFYYSPHEDALSCMRCARDGERSLIVPGAAAAYLEAVDRERPSVSRSLALDEASRAALRDLLFFLIARMLDGPLKTVETGEGII